jgi:molybdopterin molybdotransferase
MVVSLEHARRLVTAACQPLPTEVVPVADALGRILAEPLIARTPVPPFANSAMDGFAVTAGPAGRILRLVGESLAGTPSATGLDAATAIRISTGAALPPRADAVVPDELASLVDDLVELHVAAPPGLNIRLAGEDIPAGRRLLDPGNPIGPIELAVAIGTGYAQLVCHRRPRIALLGTGNELRSPGDRLDAGQIHDSNTTTLAALATQAGATIVSRGRIADDLSATTWALAGGFEHADLVILTGGVSVGPQDHVRRALAELGSAELFAGVEVRPGRPACFGTRHGLPVIALPGNPVAAIVIFVLLVRPALSRLAGDRSRSTPERVPLADPAQPSPGRATVVGVRLHQSADGLLRAVATGPLSAHATSPLLGLDAIGVLPPSATRLETGTPVEVHRISAQPAGPVPRSAGGA